MMIEDWLGRFIGIIAAMKHKAFGFGRESQASTSVDADEDDWIVGYTTIAVRSAGIVACIVIVIG